MMAMVLGDVGRGSSTLSEDWYSRLARMITRNSDSTMSPGNPNLAANWPRSASKLRSRSGSRTRLPSLRLTADSSLTTAIRRANSSTSS
jgi:hypothetical protein